MVVLILMKGGKGCRLLGEGSYGGEALQGGGYVGVERAASCGRGVQSSHGAQTYHQWGRG